MDKPKPLRTPVHFKRKNFWCGLNNTVEDIEKMTKLLTPDDLQRLKEFTSMLRQPYHFEQIMDPLCTALVSNLPPWLAPNAILMIGLLLNLASVLILYFHCPLGVEQAPPWVYYSCAAGTFLFELFSHLGKKQRMRTKNDSVLNCMLFNFCEALCSGLVPASAAMTMQLGSSFLALCGAWIGAMAFYSSHWSCFVTGVHESFGFSLSEANTGLGLIHLISAAAGPSIWSASIPLIGLPLTGVVIMVGFFSSSFVIYKNALTILEGGPRENGTTVAGSSVLSPGIPLILLWLSTSFAANFVYNEAPLLFLLAVAFAGVKLSSRVIVATLCKTKSQMHLVDSVHLWFILGFQLNHYGFGLVNHLHLLYITVVGVTIECVYYVTRVVQEVCKDQEIACFRIDPPTREYLVVTKNAPGSPSKKE